MARNGLTIGDSLLKAVLLLVVVACGARMAWELLSPILPILLTALLLVGIFAFLAGRR